MSARLLGEPFDPWRELADFQASLAAGKSGACCSFTGTMRDFNAGIQWTACDWTTTLT